jgi:PAS domain S-box-containing protein
MPQYEAKYTFCGRTTSEDEFVAHIAPRRPALRSPGTPSTGSSAAQLVARFALAAGAAWCCLKLASAVDRRPRLVAGGPAAAPAVPTAELGRWLRQAPAHSHPLPVLIAGQPALFLNLAHEGRPVAAAVLLFADASAVDVDRAAAAAALVAQTLDAERQVAALHLQAEELEARAHVREIQISRNLIRGVIDAVPMGLALLDADGVVLAANRALAERFGLDPAALVGMEYEAAIGPWQDAPAARTLATGMPGLVRRTISAPDGRETLLEIASFPLTAADGHPRQVVEVWEDITQRVALETQLVRVERLAAIGQLAASIAHEVGNPLQAIQGFLSLFLEQCQPETPNRRFLELAEEEIDRIVAVLARLRDLYRPKADVLADVQVNDLVDHVLLLTHKQLERSRISVIRELDVQLPPIRAVADQLKQVLLNLVLNAIDAMQNGGILHVRTALATDEGDTPSVRIDVTDNGAGIPPNQLPRIFDGLHTSKERGMGLGLYTSKAIVERHMGRISVQSTPGEGTTFAIVLPVRAEERQR